MFEPIHQKIDLTDGPQACPFCGMISKRHSTGMRTIYGCKTVKRVRYPKYRCPVCMKCFSLDMAFLAPKGSRYTNRVHKEARRLLKEGKKLSQIKWLLESECGVSVPVTTLADWRWTK